MRHRLLCFFALLGVSVSVLSCGSSTEGIFGSPTGGGGTGPGGTSSAIGSGPTGTAQGSGGASSSTGTLAGSGGGSSSSSAGATSSATTSASSSSASSSAVSSSSSGGGTGVIVYCADAPCAAGEVCCYDLQAPNDQCSAPGTCRSGSIELSCNSPDDCPGQVCCGDYNGNNYTGVYCQPTCDGPDKVLMCDGMPQVCDATGEVCYSSSLGGGYGYCGPP